ncbi:unnamed protein product [Allacma fusca]|uniref:Prolyl endopeptidase n=1 Tax=Allacma fusca TaxID=39272 RepID=A0A8J2PM32_9HEXA|nr:unnamed protein product [Allacma fusca]
MQASEAKFHPRVTKCFAWRIKILLRVRRWWWCRKHHFRFRYPSANRDETIVDDYHGTKVPDPYRWLEMPKTEEVKHFIKQQTAITEKFLRNCCVREFILNRLIDLYNYPKYSCPFKRGNYYYYFKKNGMEPQTILYQQESLEGDSRTFVDLNIVNNKTSVLSSFAFSENGGIFSYTTSSFGSDWVKIRFKNVDTLKDYPDVLERVKFSNIAWTHDNLGLFYSCYPKGRNTSGTDTSTGTNQTVAYHRLGTPPDEDAIVVEFPDQPTWDGHPGITKEIARFEIIPVITEIGSHLYEYVTNYDSLFYIRTNKNASNYQVVAIDFHNPVESNWTVKIPEDKLDVLQWTCVISYDKLVACYSRHVSHILKLFQLPEATLIKIIDLEMGSITCRAGKPFDSVFFFRTEFVFNPTKIYYIDFAKEELEVKLFREIKPSFVDPEDFTVKKIFYPSLDGTQIPMIITHRKGLNLNGSHFCRLYGYGGFGHNLIPAFSPQRLFTIDNLQGVEAVANVRGGGEYGENWHIDGCRHNKQNCLDDFLAAAEYLIHNNYTNPSKLAIVGSSNGGLVVAACVNQRPDLFGAAVPIVGVMDLLRFHKFTIGSCWITEYGISDLEEDFKFIYKISPLHNIKPPENDTQYPPILVMTADHDNRVVPLHSLKYLAELQHKIGQLPQQKNPLMLRVDSKTGHGTAKGYSALIQELVDIYSFFILNMNLELKIENSR